MPEGDRRFYVIPTDSEREIICVGRIELAERFRTEFGEGTHIVDTMAAPYFPMFHRVETGAAARLPTDGLGKRGRTAQNWTKSENLSE